MPTALWPVNTNDKEGVNNVKCSRSWYTVARKTSRTAIKYTRGYYLHVALTHWIYWIFQRCILTFCVGKGFVFVSLHALPDISPGGEDLAGIIQSSNSHVKKQWPVYKNGVGASLTPREYLISLRLGYIAIGSWDCFAFMLSAFFVRAPCRFNRGNSAVAAPINFTCSVRVNTN